MLSSIQTLALFPHGNASLYGYIAVFLLAFLESLALVGLTFPGTVLMTLAGGLIIFHLYDFWLLILIATFGGTLSNTLSYEFSSSIRRFIRSKPRLWLQVERGQAFFHRHKALSVFLARFRGPARALAGVIARMEGVKRPLFYTETIAAALSAAIIRLGAGYITAILLKTAFLWVSRREGFLLGLLVIAIPTFFLWKWTLRRGRNAFIVAFSLLKTALGTLVRHPAVHPLIQRYPSINSFLRRHFTRTDFFGFPFTVIFLLMAYLLYLLWQLVTGEVHHGAITVLDTQIQNLFLAFRNPALLRFFYGVTLLGNGTVIIGIAILMTAIFWVKKRKLFAYGLLINLLIVTITVWNGKLIFQRLRPGELFAAIQEISYAFPSGHATYAVAIYGFIAYVALRSRSIRWRMKMTSLFSCLSIIFLIDMSRLYLGVHYLSDVLAGNIIGVFILLWSVSLSELLAVKRSEPPEAYALSRRSYATLVLCSLLIGVSVIVTTPAPVFSVQSNQYTEEQPSAVTDILQAFDVNTSRFTETLAGTAQEPLNIVVIAPDDQCVTDHFMKAGWSMSDLPSPLSLYRAFRAAVLNEPYPSAPVTPYFYATQPQTFAFQKETEVPSIRTRHHVRFWKTNYHTPDGTLYVGTASFDRGLKWGGLVIGLTHTIEADIDTERDHVATDLEQAGVVRSSETIAFVPAMTGRNFSGDTFSTDGRAAVLVLRSCPIL